MNDKQVQNILLRIDKLQKSVSHIEKELAELKNMTMPTLMWQSTQQTEYLELLLKKLGKERGWLPPTRGWAASPDFLLLVAGYILEHKPDHIVECGCGTSSIVFARCMELNKNGHLYSLEHDKTFATKTTEMLRERDLDRHVSIIHAPLVDMRLQDFDFKWYDSSQIPGNTIDCLVIDGPPSYLGPYSRYPTGPLLFNRLSPSGVVFVDDYEREGVKQSFNQWCKEFNQLQPALEMTEKGCGVLRNGVV